MYGFHRLGSISLKVMGGYASCLTQSSLLSLLFVSTIVVLLISKPYISDDLYAEPRPTTQVKPSELIGTWRGAGVDLNLYPNGTALLNHSAQSSMILQSTSPDPNQRLSINISEGLTGFWWAIHTSHERRVCLFFDLTARCFPISFSLNSPNLLSIHLGMAHVELFRSVPIKPSSKQLP